MSMRLNIKEVEDNVTKLVKGASFEIEFIYNLLLAYGKPPASITRLKKGTYNLAKDKNTEIYWKNSLFFKYVEHEDLHSTIDDLRGDAYVIRHNPRFVVVTDFKQLLAMDTKTEETLDIPIDEIDKHFVFFLPWAGMEKSQHKTENIADVKAAERMAKLYDEIIKHNESDDPAFYHALNVFFSRLLFCFFAEDTEVFDKGQFTNSITSHTQIDGSDLNSYLDELFKAMDVEDKTGYPSHIKAFPYVNGGLFNRTYAAPEFNAQARRLIIECGELDWAQINPDIFGSMIQAVVHPGQRAGLGMHYTSVVNIMKVIGPLFLEELLEEFDKADGDEKKLTKLLHRIYALKVFDPACGSGNFLIIAFKELRRLEHRILEQLLENKLAVKINSGLKLENFYGIEIDDFAREVAILSLWLAKHQMNIEFKQKFGKDIPLIPLKDTGNVVCDNAARTDWKGVCPVNPEDEVYLISNPPYAGFKMQSKEQKQDIAYVFSYRRDYKKMDYISCWFRKASHFIEDTNAKYAFVATNSICQGEHVDLLWPDILGKNREIFFAHTSFKWSNNAKHNAGVTCVVVGIRDRSSMPKKIISGTFSRHAANINAYLTDGPDIIVGKRSKPISSLPKMSLGNMPKDDGNLLLTKAEVADLINKDPRAKEFIRPAVGAREFLNSLQKWCIWIRPDQFKIAKEVPLILERIDKVRKFRSDSSDKSANQMASTPFMFREQHEAKHFSIIVPTVTSERRQYIPMGLLDSNSVVIAPNNVIYDPDLSIFAVVSSRMHVVWVKAVAGQLETRIRYSSTLCYNTFPLPQINEKQRSMLINHANEVIEIRERYSEKTLAELYDPDKMPDDLRKAHGELDEVVELCYRSKPFENDEERLAYLFKLYEIMTGTQKELV